MVRPLPRCPRRCRCPTRCRGCGATTATWPWSLRTDGSVTGDGGAGGPGRGPRRHRARRDTPWSDTVLDADRAWNAPRTRHTPQRVGRVPAAAPERSRVEAHPVWDFLFTYYSLRPRQLRVWHPGFGVALAGEAARRYLDRSGYGRGPDGVAVTREYLLARADTVLFIAGLLRATASRPARLNCFGLHEWAMVYRATDRAARPGPAAARRHRHRRRGGVNAVAVQPLRRVPVLHRTGRGPQRRAADPGTQVATEQPGCLHAAMDCTSGPSSWGRWWNPSWSWTAWSWPPTPVHSTCGPAPMTSASYGFEPIAVETPAGRAEYVRAQQTSPNAPPAAHALAARCETLPDALS